MKKFAILLAATAFAACSSEPAEEAVETAAAEDTAAAASNALPGTYEVTTSDGTKFTAVLNEDGTYTDTSAEGEVFESGTWAVTDGKTCFTPAPDSEGELTCYTDTPIAEDGIFTATPDEGDPITVKKVA